jgi:glycosyltransferase involved in cell wall biosynthesis
MLNYEYPPLGGGAGNACYHMLKEYALVPDISIDLVTSSANNRLEIEQFSDNIQIYKVRVNKKNLHHWKMSEILVWSVAAFLLMNRLMRKNHYDLCHCWFGWPSGIFGYIFRRRIPYIIALRGSDIPGHNPRLRTLDLLLFTHISKIVWKHARRVTVLSKNSLRMAKHTLDRDYDIIYNGVDTGVFYPVDRNMRELKILFVGRLTEGKGVEHIIRAVADLRGKYPEDAIRATIVGSGNREPELRALAQQLHLTDQVSFLGAIEHEKVPDIYREHDIFILPSVNEALGNAAQEAIASGLALLTTDTGAAELLDGNGFLIKKGDYADISEKVSVFLQNPDTLTRCKRRSSEIARDMPWKSCVHSYVQLYESII